MLELKLACLDDCPVQRTVLACFIVHQDPYCGGPVGFSLHHVICLHKMIISHEKDKKYCLTNNNIGNVPFL